MKLLDPLKALVDSHTIEYNSSCRYYAIGDVHGCIDEYNALTKLIYRDAASHGKHAIIIQLGDMIDRGPSFEELLVSDPAHYRVMGNHELNFIVEHHGYKACRSNARKLNHERLSANADQADVDNIIALLSQRKAFYTLKHPSGKLIVLSHAPINGIEKGWGERYYLGIASSSHFCMRSTPVDLEQLNRSTSATFVHGHQSWGYADIKEQIQAQQNSNAKVYNLDSGCVYGNTLTALNLFTDEVFQVQSSIKVAHSN